MADYDDDTLIDDGKVIPIDPRKVRRTVNRMLEQGDLLAVIVKVPSGDVAVQVFGPPSLALADLLAGVARDLRAATVRAARKN